MLNKVDYKKLTHPIARYWLDGNDLVWKNTLEDIIEKQIPKTIDDDTTFQSLVNDIKYLVNEELLPYIEENMYDILSERELFNERDWENKAESFKQALKVYMTDKVDYLASDILDKFAEDAEYSRSPYRFFGTREDDF